MSVDFGLALVESHPKTKLTQWMDDLDVILPQLEGHFKSLWMTDHLFWEDLYAYEAWTVLSFLAARWPRFDIGPMVMGQSYRNPGLLAKMAATLQVFSQGRFIMGIGAGWKEDEYHAYDFPYPSAGVRLEQLVDTLEIMKRLWTEPDKVTYQGKHYAVRDAYFEPKPDPAPPIVIGVAGDRALRIAAQYADWWNLSDAPIDQFKERLGVLHRHCDAIGRDPKSIRLSWFGRVVVGRTEPEIHKLAHSRLKPYSPDNAFVGTPAQIAEEMSKFVEAGVDYFMIDIVGLPNPDIVGMILEEILPKVQK
jgi:alkanesulfonate monooxygenase SsuD/methylene tetrahydromethanopterin reductase-like flavin-dependent oxidoreductase (luciferase family)